MAAFAFSILQRAIIAREGCGSLLAGAIGSDWKGKLSIICYFTASGLAFVNQWLSDALCVFVAVMWLIPDRRVERALFCVPLDRSECLNEVRTCTCCRERRKL